MSKVEKFIEDYTNHCSNELDYVGTTCKVYQPWLTPEQALRAVEIEREEILQKVYDFFKGIGDWDYPAERMIQDFRKYMEGEQDMTDKDCYPITIVADRYGGTYSGGKWLAFNIDYHKLPVDIDGDDITCANFWKSYKGKVGKGISSKDALKNLIDIL